MTRTGGGLLVDCLEAQGVERVFCVPGESYLEVLDALHDSTIQTVVARQEGGASMMAEADGKLTGRPGVAIATRGPGGTNAASGVHVASHDSTPMLLLIGQVARGMRERGAFQEIDYRQTYGDLAKWVGEVDDADRIPEIISHAFHVAMSGRPGPVVLVLPEDMLTSIANTDPGSRVDVAEPAPTPGAVEQFSHLLVSAQRPFLVLGGSRWSAEAVARAQDFAARHDLPASVTFRRQGLFDHLHENYAGDVGLGINPELRKRLADSDLVILLGGRFSEVPSQSFSVLDIPEPHQKVVHIHPGAEELGRIYHPTLAINATPGSFLAAVSEIDGIPSRERGAAAHASYRAWSDVPPSTPGAVQMGEVMLHLRETLDDDAILTNGAGNYATWIHRFWRFRRYGTQLAPVSGSMGYGMPAAIAAKLRHPDREVVCFAGDGCFQMTMQEFGTAMQHGANIVVLVVDNGIYGTIRMHQERHHPGRVSATTLVNPDFAKLAGAYGGHGETVAQTAEFPAAFERARNSGKAAIIHLKTDPEAITPTLTIRGLRAREG